MKTWALQDAKNRLSEVVDEAQRSPQVITRRGKDTAILVSIAEYARLVETKGRVIDLLRKAPKVPGGLAIDRSPDTGRDSDL